jgi:hypothetical protein
MFSGTFFLKHRRLTYVVASSIIGFGCAIFINMRVNDIASAKVAAVPFGVAFFWLIGVFLIDLICRVRAGASNGNFSRAAAWSGICMGTVVLAWLFGAIAFPDTAGLYLVLQRSYIDTHWRVDPVTRVTYFPLAFEKADAGGATVVPRSFFVLDKYSELIVSSGELMRPSCPNATYLARRLEGQIYILQQYAEQDAYLTPCLVTPAPKSELPP